MLNFSRKYVCESREYSTYQKHIPAPLFRKSFKLTSPADFAEVLITGIGFYRLFVNGTEITKGYIAPYVSNPDDIVYFDSYDIAPMLKRGENVIGVMLGDGFANPITNVWDFDKTVWTSSPKFAATVKVCSAGTTLEFEADAFRCTKGPITFNNHRCGVHYDARLEQDGWNAPGFKEKKWHAPLAADPPRGEAKLCEAEPIAVRSEFAPVSVAPGEVEPYIERDDVKAFMADTKAVECDPPYTGGYIYDFGKNSAGIFRLKIKGAKEGQKISFQCAERLSEDGKLDYRNINFFPDGYCQRDIYICKGADEEIYEPPFIYHGYRYLYVHGITEEQAVPELLTYVEINTKLDERGFFSCSDDIANKLFEMAKNSDMSNFHYFPTDCPHREKNGWTGDAAASAEHMVMTLSVENSWREWMNNIRKAQNSEGRIPGIVPTSGWGFAWGNGPAWDRVMFDLPYYTYIYRGDTRMITENAHMMLGYLEHLTRVRDEYGIVNWGLGDWCPVYREEWGPAIDFGFTNGIMIMDMCKKGAEMFDAVGLGIHADFARTLGAEMKASVRKRYLDEATMTLEGCYQSAQAMAVFYDLLEPAEKQKAVEVLVELIHKNDDHFSFGYLGARCIFHVLSDYGYADLAYKMITRTDFPSYGMFVADGLTTLPEHFYEKSTDRPSYGSLNHHFFGDINHWFLRSICGINVNPYGKDPNEIIIKPHFVEGLAFAEGTYRAPGGEINVKWTRAGEDVILSVKPSGCIKGRIRLDNGYVFESRNIAFMDLGGGVEGAKVVKKTI